MWIFWLFFAVPLIEIALFVTVGAWLTLWPTLAIVLATGVLGSVLVRHQGIGVLRELQQAGIHMTNPVSPLAHGALILMGGFMLILPGFFTDFLGFLLMIPPLRRVLIRVIAERISLVDSYDVHTRAGVGGETSDASRGSDDHWIDADFEEIPRGSGR